MNHWETGRTCCERVQGSPWRGGMFRTFTTGELFFPHQMQRKDQPRPPVPKTGGVTKRTSERAPELQVGLPVITPEHPCDQAGEPQSTPLSTPPHLPRDAHVCLCNDSPSADGVPELSARRESVCSRAHLKGPHVTTWAQPQAVGVETWNVFKPQLPLYKMQPHSVGVRIHIRTAHGCGHIYIQCPVQPEQSCFLCVIKNMKLGYSLLCAAGAEN